MTVNRGYNLALEDSRRRMQAELRLGQWLQANQRQINQLYKQALAIHDARPDETYLSINTFPEGKGGCVHIQLSLRGLEGLKDPALEKALLPFVDAPESLCTDFAQYMNRDYQFKWPLENGRISVTVSAYVKEENPTCRRILVERRTVPRTEEIYKLACDGDIIEAPPVDLKLVAPEA